MMPRHIFLLDMDGVLLTPGGYHGAVEDTVAFMGSMLGFERVHLSQDDIYALEAAGITNEWDTAAICLALLADTLWSHDPDLAISPAQIARPHAAHGLTPPDFQAFFERLAAPARRSEPGLERAFKLLPARAQRFFREAYVVQGLSQRLQQEHVLGSQAFQETYGLPPALELESYLLIRDRSNVRADARKDLRAWNAHPANQALIFTNRPGGLDGLPGQADYSTGQRVPLTPEAELGARCVGLSDLPIMGSGGIMWLEARRGTTLSTFNKPHPIHALAALAHAAGAAPQVALRRAARLALDQDPDPDWRELELAAVWVLEDSSGGLRSLKTAAELLAQHGIHIAVELIGVAGDEKKTTALTREGAQVFTQFEAALAHAMAGSNDLRAAD
jgi:hypothetical protein